MKVKEMNEELAIPDGVQVTVNDEVILKGAKGELKKRLVDPKVKISVGDNKVLFSAKNATKRQKTMMGTFKAHVRNMMKGVTEGHVYKLKICAGHFPMNVAVKGNEFIVKNFLGEKVPRTVKIKEGVSVKIEGEIVVIESIDKELAGQCATLIEQLTRITNRDRRIFMDGIWIIEKDGKEVQ